MTGVARMVRRSSVDYIKPFFIRGETEAVRLFHVVCNHRGLAGLRVDSVDVGRKLESSPVAFVVSQDSVTRIGEPGCPVRMDHNIVWRVESLTLEMVHQYGDAAVVLGARHPPRVMLAGDESTLLVAGIAVAVIGGATEDADLAGLLDPAHDPVVGYVAPKQVAAVPEPDGAFSPPHTSVQSFDRRVGDAVLREAWIDNFDCRLGIPDRSR